MSLGSVGSNAVSHSRWVPRVFWFIHTWMRKDTFREETGPYGKVRYLVGDLVCIYCGKVVIDYGLY
jgi:hypothetical protein